MSRTTGRTHYRVKRKEICNRYDTDSHIFIDELFTDDIIDKIYKTSIISTTLLSIIILLIIMISMMFGKYIGTTSAQIDNINDIAVEFKANEFKTGGN